MKYEAANKILEEMQKKNEQMMREKEASYQEHVKQLTEKMEKERAQLIAEQERVLALQVFNCGISILSSTVLNQKLLEVRALYQFKDCSSPSTSRHFISLLLLPLTISQKGRELHLHMFLSKPSIAFQFWGFSLALFT